MKLPISLPRPHPRTVGALVAPFMLALGTALAVGGLVFSLAAHVRQSRGRALRA